MNIYTKKQRWKIYLLFTALIIIALSFWYTNEIVKKVAAEERKNVKLWAEAIQRKAKLVKYTKELFEKLQNEERKKVELWAKGTKLLIAAPLNDESNLSFASEVVTNNETIPVILLDENGKIITYRNIEDSIVNDSIKLKHLLKEMKNTFPPIQIDLYKGKKHYLYYKNSKLFTELKKTMNDLIQSFISEIVMNTASVPVILTNREKNEVIAYGNIDSSLITTKEKIKNTIKNMENANNPIVINIDDKNKQYVFYENSYLLKQLQYYPLVQFAVISLFLLVAYLLFSSARKAEQDLVWVGMARETAHQIGTPLSSLLAWMEILHEENPELASEISKDINRFEVIAERFSKIGTTPELKSHNIYNVVLQTVDYLQNRISKKINIKINADKMLEANISKPLFQWVIENIIKNAIDAINGEGEININICKEGKNIIVDIKDTGKGISKSKLKTVFNPGYTTKKRGWGLGLSLSKRIIEKYHKGKIFIKWSAINKGTEFRIILH